MKSALLLALGLLLPLSSHAQDAASAAPATASYIEGGKWNYPGLDDILAAGQAIYGDVSVDCALRPNGHVEGCLVTPLDDKTQPDQQNAIGAAYQLHATADPSSIDGGIQPGDRVRFHYDFNNLPASDIAGAAGLPLLDPAHKVATGAWTYPTGDVMARHYPSAAVDKAVESRVVLDCRVAADGSIPACRVLAELNPDYGFGEVTADMFTRYTHVDPASVTGGIPDGAYKLFTYVWTIGKR